MQYALFIYEDEAAIGKTEESPAFKDRKSQHMAFAGELMEKGIMRGGAGLKDTGSATTVRLNGGGRAVHDGPFAESKEQLGGFYIVEADDLDAAIALAKRVPLSEGGSIEIRPVLGM